MITQLILKAAILLLTQIEVRVECDEPTIYAGDILFQKTSFKNNSDEEFVVDVPTRGISYVTNLSYKSINSTPWHAGMAATTNSQVAPRKELDEIVLIAPWQDFSEPVFDDAKEIRDLEKNDDIKNEMRIWSSTEIVLYQKMSDGALIPLENFRNSSGQSDPKKYKSGELQISVKGSVLASTKNRKLYRLRSERPPVFVAENFWRGRDIVDRNCPVGAWDFDLPLDWSYYDSEKLRQLIAVVNPQARLHRVLKLIQLSNEWVQTPNGEARDAKERAMLEVAAAGGPIESEYLVAKTKELIDSKKREVGEFRPLVTQK